MIGEILEEGGSIVGQTVKTIKQTPGDLKNAAKSQATLPTHHKKGAQNSNEEIVKSLYEKSDQVGTPPQESDEAAELAKTRNELQAKKQAHQQQHDITYYNPTFNQPKPQEERPAEKVEREQQQEMQDLQQKEAEKPNHAVKRAQNIEKFRGVSG